jgi:hypothetical protein
LVHIEDVRKYRFIYIRTHQLCHVPRCTGSTSTMSCATATRLWAQLLFINYAVRWNHHQGLTVCIVNRLNQ